MKRILLLLISLVALLAGQTARASIAYGSINNFDTVNDTGHTCHGFEIEIEDCRTTDITYTYNYNHYGVPRFEQDDTDPLHPKCRIRWESKKNADGSWASYTAIPSGPIAPTNGHMFTNPSVNFGGENFGVGYSKAVGLIKYNWLIDNGSGALVYGGAVQVSTPTFTYFPPVAAAPAQVQAVIVPPVPPVPPVKEFGKAVWVKEIKTTTHNNKEIKLRELVSDDPADLDDKNWANGEPDEVEIEWRILQKRNIAGGGANDELVAAPEDLPNGDEVVTRRYEFYKYNGPLDGESGEAMADAVDPDGIHGTGMRTYNHHMVGGEWVTVTEDMATYEVVGDFTGSQMAAVDVEAPVGLIDHVSEGKINTAYAARTVVVEGALPFTAVQEGALPPGMTFDEVTGVLDGTPTASGSFQFKVTASDGVNPDVSKNYTLTVAAPGAPAPPASLLDTTVLPVGAGTTTGDGSYAIGANATATATPNTGFAFLNWTDNGTIVSTNASYTLAMDVNHSLVANFVPVFIVTTSAAPIADGTTTGDGSYNGGANVTVVATPNAGYAFTNWTEGGLVVSSSATFTFAAASDRDLVANFTLGTSYTITTASAPVAGGSTSGGASYASGSSVTVIATPNAGYNFVNWTESGTQVSANASYTFNATANRTLVANFAVIGGTTRTISTVASPLLGGTTSGGGVVADGSNVTVVATANPGYKFDKWKQNGTTVSTTASYTFTATADRTLTATFIKVYYVTATPAPSVGGTTEMDSTSYKLDENARAIATPNAGYQFVNWTEGGTVVSSSATYTFTASANRTLVANFTAGNTITATATPISGGSVSGGGTFAPGTSVTLTATANPGYTFINWTNALGTEVSVDAAYTFTPTTSGIFTANFEAPPLGLRFDFDTATPVPALNATLPLDQLLAGYTASFSESVASSFKITTETASGRVLSNFTGNYLEAIADNGVLTITFDQPVTGVSLDFATVEALNVPVASNLQISAYNSATGALVGTGIAHGTVTAGDTLPVGSLEFNSATAFDQIVLQLPDVPVGAVRFLVDNILISPGASTGGSMLLANPNWNITLTDFGYSDFLLDNTPGFEGREYLSGEWGAAVAYTRGNGNTVSPKWLEPNFLYPDWATNSNFTVVQGIHLVGTNLDGLPIAESVIANNDLQITLRFEMVDTVTGTPMGITPASSTDAPKYVDSNRYVMNQTVTLKNISGGNITNLQLFQLLHGFISQRGQYDNRSYAGKLSQYQYDVTMSGVDAGAAGTQSSSIGLEDLIGFHSKIAPSAFELGHYGIEGNGIDDHSAGKPSDGVHLSIEDNWQNAPYLGRQNRDSFAPAQRWVSGAQRWELGSLADGQSVNFDIVLSLLTGTKVVVTGGGGGGTGGGGSCNGGSGHTGGVDFEFEDIDQEGTFFGEYSEADDDEMLEREDDGEFTTPAFELPNGTRRQRWNLTYSGTHTGSIKLKFAYNPALLPAGYDENQLVIYHFRNGQWEKLVCKVDPTTNTIEAITPILSPFMLGVNDTVVKPDVQMSITTPGTLNVSWPDTFLGWQLQESTNLSTWTNSTRPITNDAGTNKVSIPVSSGVKFFRLLRP